MNFNPYVGSRPFMQEDRHLFFGRAREARQLSALASFEQLVLLYGQSGVGKTSLINTRLFPALEAEGFEILPVGRVSGYLPLGMVDNIEQLHNIFIFNLLLCLDRESHDPGLFVGMGLSDFLFQYYNAPYTEVQQDHYNPEQQRFRVLLVDQFEEIFTRHVEHWEKRSDLFMQLSQALKDHPSLSIILSMREDYLAQLDPYISLLPGKLRTRFRLGPLGYNAALAAIKGPAKNAGRPFAPGHAHMLVDELRRLRAPSTGEAMLGPFVEPVQLQVVCHRLWENLPEQEDHAIQWEEIREYGNVDQALIGFYEQAIAEVVHQTDVSEINLRDWFATKLITAAGTRSIVYRGMGQTGGLPNEAVDLLAGQFLLRREAKAGGIWYELIHDRFIQPILESNRSWISSNPLIQMVQAWADSGYPEGQLLKGQQLQEVLSTSGWQEMGPLVREFIEASQTAQTARELSEQALWSRREKQMLVVGALIGGIIGIIGTLFVTGGLGW